MEAVCVRLPPDEDAVFALSGGSLEPWQRPKYGNYHHDEGTRIPGSVKPVTSTLCAAAIIAVLANEPGWEGIERLQGPHVICCMVAQNLLYSSSGTP